MSVTKALKIDNATVERVSGKATVPGIKQSAGHYPNMETRMAIQEVDAGGGKSFETFEDLMEDLNDDD